MWRRKVPISISFEPKTLEEVDSFAGELSGSRSLFIAEAIDSYVKQLKEVESHISKKGSLAAA